MGSVFKIWYRLLLVFILSGCSGNFEQEDAVIREAARLMQEQPDSALRVLGKVSRHSLRGETLARYALIHSIAQDKSGQDVTNDSLLRIAYAYYSRHPEDSLYARSQYYMGLYFSLVDSTKQAEDCLRTSVRYAGKRKEYYTQYLALDRLSREIRCSDALRALGYSKQALDICSRKCSSHARNLIYLMKDIGKVYILCNQEDSALYYMDMALAKAKQLDESSMIGEVMQDKSLVYSIRKDFRQALSSVKEAWRMFPVKSINLIFRLAECYADADSAAQAKDLFATIVNVGDYGQKYLAYKSLSVIAAREHEDSLSLLYADSAYESMEAIHKQHLRTKAAYYDEILHLEETKLQQERENAQNRLFFIVFSVIALAVTYNIWYRYKCKNEAERERHRLLEESARKQYEIELAGRESQISMMRNMILERYDFRKKIEKLKVTGKHISLMPEDWKEIAGFLEACDNSFVTRFREKYPNISEKDYQLCLLLRCGFTNPDLELVYSNQIQVIKNKQREVKKKLGIEDEKRSLRQYIKGF